MTALSLRLYHRRGCHLCDDMLEELELLCQGRPVELELVDIDADSALSERFGADIPVLEHAGEILCRHRLDRQRVRALF